MANAVIPDSLKTKLHLLANTFEKTDRIITGKDVTVAMTFDPNVSVPSRTDGKRIEINALQVPDLGAPRTLVTLLGLNYHEACHVLYSPRIGSDFHNVIVRKGWHYAYNVLEDMRIEALFGARYGSASKYLSAPVISLIVKNEDLWPTAHILTHGRRYLPLQVREMLRDKFTGDDDVRDEIESLIDRYRKLVFDTPHKYIAAERIIKRFAELVQDLSGQLHKDELKALMESGCGSEVKEGKPDQAQEAAASRRLVEQDQEQEAAEEDGEDGSGFYDGEGEEEDEDEADDDGSDSDSPDGDDGDGESDSEDAEPSDASDGDPGDGEGNEDGDSDGVGSDEDSPEEEPAPSDLPGTQGRGDGSPDDGDGDDSDGLDPDELEAGDGVGGPPTDEEIAGTMNDMLERLENSTEVQQQLTKLHDAMNDSSQIDVEFPPARVSKREAPSGVLASASRAVSGKLTRLYEDLEAGWDYGSDHGRLNVSRMMGNPDDRDSWFDEWTEGHTQDAGLEVFIMVDVSMSMEGVRIGPACEAVWVLTNALQQIEADVTVISFGDRTSTVLGRGEKANAGKVSYYAANQGDTMPIPGMREAARVMAASEKPNKLFVIITDGVWSAYDESYSSNYNRQYIDARKVVEAIDAQRCYIGINATAEDSYAGAFDVCATIGEADGIVPVVDSIVEGILRSAANR